MASYGLEFYRSFVAEFADEGVPADIGFRRQGYLFVSDNGGAAQMARNFRLQESLGVEVEMLSPDALGKRFPSISTAGVDMAVLSDHDAWIDPYAALLGFKRKARTLGVVYVEAEVKGFIADDVAVRSAELANRETITASIFVNACGAWCAELAATIGLELPVEPMSRESYYLHCAKSIEPLPFLKTETDLAFRPEGTGYIGGIPDWSESAGWNFDVSPTHFEHVVWPALAKRIPAMEEIRLERSWRGHYARNRLDYSPILGRWEGGLENFILANGFSGHGIMHAPAAGRGLAELILHDQYRTIDLGCFGYRRVLENRPYREQGII
jgi:glycine/D-amino acid oxidase-like deaminating enzyme